MEWFLAITNFIKEIFVPLSVLLGLWMYKRSISGLIDGPVTKLIDRIRSANWTRGETHFQVLTEDMKKPETLPSEGEATLTFMEFKNAITGIDSINTDIPEDSYRTAFESLLMKGITTKTQLNNLLSPEVINTLKAVYKKTLYRKEPKPLDPEAIGSYAPILYQYGINPDIILMVESQIMRDVQRRIARLSTPVVFGPFSGRTDREPKIY